MSRPHKNRSTAPYVEIYKGYLIHRLDRDEVLTDLVSEGAEGEWTYAFKTHPVSTFDTETTYRAIDDQVAKEDDDGSM